MPIKTAEECLALVGRLVAVGLHDDHSGKIGREFIGVVQDLSDSGRHLVLTSAEESYFETEEAKVPVILRHARIAVPLENIEVIDPTRDVRYRADGS